MSEINNVIIFCVLENVLNYLKVIIQRFNGGGEPHRFGERHLPDSTEITSLAGTDELQSAPHGDMTCPPG